MNMKIRCVRYAGEHDHLYLTIGKIYEGKINRYYDFFSTADNDDEMGHGCSRLSFEWVDGTPAEKNVGTSAKNGATTGCKQKHKSESKCK